MYYFVVAVVAYLAGVITSQYAKDEISAGVAYVKGKLSAGLAAVKAKVLGLFGK